MLRITAAAALFAAAPAVAADNAGAGNGDIIVTGYGLPATPGTAAYGSTLLDRDALNGAASGSLEGALSDVAGFQQFRRSDSRSANPTAQGITLRALGGNAASRTLLLLDGVPMTDPFFGHVPFNAIAPESLGYARVTPGGGVGAFGAGALAGTIELASAGRADLPLIAASAMGGSNAATELSATLSPDLGQGYVSLTGRWNRGDGFYTAPADQRVPESVRAAYDNWSAGFRAVAPVAPGLELQARLLAFSDNRVLRFAGADNHTEGQDASIRLVGGSDWKIDALAYVQARDFSNIVVSSTSFRPVLNQRATPATGIGGKIELRPPTGERHALRVGVDYRRSSGNAAEDVLSAATGAVTARRNAGGNSADIGFFAEDDWKITGRLVLTGGVRADRWTLGGGFLTQATAGGAVLSDQRYSDRDGWQANGRAGLLWKATSAINLRAAGYTGFRMPTLNELYRPYTLFPVTTLANAGLKPEKLKGVEAGVDYRPLSDARIGLTIFHNRLDDAITNVTIGTNLRQRRNIDSIRATGVELSAGGRIGALRIDASYAFSHSRMHGSGPSAPLDGYQPAQSPQHMAAATVAWAPRHGPGLALTGRYVGDQFEDDRQSDRLHSAFTLDAVAHVPFGHGLQIEARGENLFDAEVVARNSGGTIDLGTPRILWIGLRFVG